MIPDYDRVTTPSPIPSRYHDDIEVISELLQLRITFQWRPLLDHQVLTTIKHYLADERLRPDWILLGPIFDFNHSLCSLSTVLYSLQNNLLVFLNICLTVTLYNNRYKDYLKYYSL